MTDLSTPRKWKIGKGEVIRRSTFMCTYPLGQSKPEKDTNLITLAFSCYSLS